MKKLLASIFFILITIGVYAEELDASQLSTKSQGLNYFLENNWTIEKVDDETFKAVKEGVTFLFEDVYNVYVRYKDNKINMLQVAYYGIPTVNALRYIASYLKYMNTEFIDYEMSDEGTKVCYIMRQTLTNGEVTKNAIVTISLKEVDGLNLLMYMFQV